MRKWECYMDSPNKLHSNQQEKMSTLTRWFTQLLMKKTSSRLVQLKDITVSLQLLRYRMRYTIPRRNLLHSIRVLNHTDSLIRLRTKITKAMGRATINNSTLLNISHSNNSCSTLIKASTTNSFHFTLRTREIYLDTVIPTSLIRCDNTTDSNLNREGKMTINIDS